MAVEYNDSTNLNFEDRTALIWYRFSGLTGIESVEITPSVANIYLGDELQYHVIVTYKNGVIADLTDEALWSTSSSPSIADFSTETPGLLTSTATGTCAIVVGVPNLFGFFEFANESLTIHNPLIVEQAHDLVDQYRPVVDDYIKLFTSQYQNSTKLLAWARSFMDIVDDIKDLAQNLSFYFSLFRVIDKDAISYVPNALTTKAGSYTFTSFDACVGNQLDILGVILGVPRQVTFDPTDGSSPILDDDTYRILLKNQVLKNHWDGRAESLQTTWKELFPGGKIIVQDNQNMTIDVTITGTFTQIIIDLIENDYIVPRPQGVWMNYYVGTISPANLPFFGFDRRDAYVSGFDEGHWV